MFISKSSHLKILQVYEARILDLQSQIEDLKKFAIPKQSILPLIELEADAILSNRESPMKITEEQIKELEEAGHEASRVFLGTYDYESD